MPEMPSESREINVELLSHSSGLALCVVLSVLYLALVLRDWRSLAEFQAMIVPFVVFGLFSGLVMSLVPWVRRATGREREIRVIITSSSIALGGIAMQIVLMSGGLPFSSAPGLLIRLKCWVYPSVAIGTVAIFGAVGLLGHALADPVRRAVRTIGRIDALSAMQADVVSTLVTGVLGLVGAVLTALMQGR